METFETTRVLASHFFVAISQNRTVDHRIVVVQIDVEEFEVLVVRFRADVQVVCVRQKSRSDWRYVGWRVVTLLKCWIEGVQDDDHVQLRSVAEVRPVKSVGHVVLVDGAFNVLVQLLFSFEAHSDIDSVNVYALSDFHYGFHEAAFVVIGERVHNYGIINSDAVRFNGSFKTGIEVFVRTMKNIDISIIIFTCYKVKVISEVYYIPQELIFYPWKIILTISIKHIVLHSIWKNHFLEIVWNFYYYCSIFVYVRKGSQIIFVLVFENIENFDTLNSVSFTSDHAFVRILSSNGWNEIYVVDFFVFFMCNCVTSDLFGTLTAIYRIYDKFSFKNNQEISVVSIKFQKFWLF